MRPGFLTNSGGLENHSSGTILGRTAQRMPSKKSLMKLNHAPGGKGAMEHSSLENWGVAVTPPPTESFSRPTNETKST